LFVAASFFFLNFFLFLKSLFFSIFFYFLPGLIDISLLLVYHLSFFLSSFCHLFVKKILMVDAKIKEYLKLIRDNGNSDIVIDKEGKEGKEGKEEEEKIDKKELYENLNTVEEKWYEVLPEDLKYIIPSGKPPSNISKEDDKEITQRCTSFGKIIKYKVPIIWLLLRMRHLKVDANFTDEKITELCAEYSSPPSITSNNEDDNSLSELWTKVVEKYNGYVRILKELHQFCKDEDGQPSDFVYDFYQERDDEDDGDDNKHGQMDVKKVKPFEEFTPFEDKNIEEIEDEEEDTNNDCEEDSDEDTSDEENENIIVEDDKEEEEEKKEEEDINERYV
jgi:hypothetical protein